MTHAERDLLLGCIGALMKLMQREDGERLQEGEPMRDQDLIVALYRLAEPHLPPEHRNLH